MSRCDPCGLKQKLFFKVGLLSLLNWSTENKGLPVFSDIFHITFSWCST